MKTVKVLPAALIIFLFTVSAFAQEATRITFSHVEATSWSDSRETEGYIVEWNMTTAVAVSFPVDVDAYNNGTINPPSTDQVYFRLSTPEYEGEVNITVSGYVNVTAKGIIPLTGYTEFQNTTSIPVTTPLGEWEISYPIPVPVPVGALVIVVTVEPTLYINASVTAKWALTGPAIAFTPPLTWKTDGAIKNVTVIPVNAEKGDEIVVSAENFTYNWNASLTVELLLQGIHLITSPPYWFETPSLQADGEATVSFNIQVIPDSPSLPLIVNFTYLPSSIYAQGMVTFDASASFGLYSTVVNFTWDFGDGNITTLDKPVVTHTYTLPDNYNVTLTVTDEFGFKNSTVTSFTILQDDVPPTTVDDYDGELHNADFTITLTATDYESGVAETYYQINDGPVKAVSVDGQPRITAEGANNTLEYWCVDNAGNEELPHPILTGIKLDKTAPTGSITINNDASYTNSTSVTLTLTANDATSGIYQVRYSNDGTWDTEPWETHTPTKAWTLTPGDGTKTAYYQIKDKAGLVSVTYSDTIILETPPPPAEAFPPWIIGAVIVAIGITVAATWLLRKRK